MVSAMLSATVFISNPPPLRQPTLFSTQVQDSFCSQRAKPRWTCRKQKPHKGKVNGDSTGRGRSRKRSAFYDAMKVYYDHFEPLLQAELQAEHKEVLEQRRARSAQGERLSHGYSMFNLTVTKENRLYSQEVFALKTSKGTDIRTDAHKFRKGDLVSIISNGAGEDSAIEATVLAKSPRELRVTVPLGSDASNVLESFSNSQEQVSVDLGTNSVAFERVLAALSAITTPGPDASDMVKFLVMSFRKQGMVHGTRPYFDISKRNHTDQSKGSRHGDESVKDSKWADFARESVAGVSQAEINKEISYINGLNNSQKDAIRAAARRRLTLIQGPPGTGKTLTTAYLISTAVRLGLGPILACAASNIAADNLMQKVLDVTSSLNVVRVGRVAAIDEKLWKNSLDCILEKIGPVKSARTALAKNEISVKKLMEVEKTAIHTILEKADVVVSTCMGSGRDDLSDLKFPLITVDEATQATETDILIPMAIKEGKQVQQVVLVGDQCQLPPTVLSRTDGDGLGRSLFLRLWEERIDCKLLDTQYRMHPQISKFPSIHFYSKRLQDGVSPNGRPLPSVFNNPTFILDGRARSVLIHVSEGEESKDSSLYEGGGIGTSFFNPEEAKVVLHVCELLTVGDQTSTGFSAEQIGIISPYAGQVRMIGKLVAQAKRLKSVEVSTVDGFQGRENDVIVVSSVRSNSSGKVGFLEDWRRLNVAITRARKLLIVVGDMDTLRNDPHWGAWTNWVKRYGVVIAAEKLQRSFISETVVEQGKNYG